MKIQNRKFIIIRVLAIIFLFLGLIGWFVPFFGAPYNSSTELPNSDPHGIDIDKEDNIYCGSASYGRVQMYNQYGKFIRGFDTHGGTGRGSNFCFYLDESNHLCIHVYSLAKSEKDTFHKITIYDPDGEVVGQEKYTSPENVYFCSVKNTATDSKSNVYTFKGILFPRVIRRVINGEKSVIIQTPLWLWFFQSPFPAFTFFFVSMFIIIFLADNAALLEYTVNILSVRENQSKLLKSMVTVIIIIAALIISIVYGLKTSSMMVIFGFISLIITIALAGLVLLLYGLRWTWYFHRNYSELSKNRLHSMKERLEHGRSIREATANDPFLGKIKTRTKKIVILCFLIWIITLTIGTVFMMITK